LRSVCDELRRFWYRYDALVLIRERTLFLASSDGPTCPFCLKSSPVRPTMFQFTTSATVLLTSAGQPVPATYTWQIPAALFLWGCVVVFLVQIKALSKSCKATRPNWLEQTYYHYKSQKLFTIKTTMPKSLAKSLRESFKDPENSTS